jgi:hypothetical protein
MTVRETLDFSGRCLGVGTRYEMLAELSRREREAGIKPDPEIDAFMKATAMSGQKTSLVTDYILKVHCLSFMLLPLFFPPTSQFKIADFVTTFDRYLDWIFVRILWLEMT